MQTFKVSHLRLITRFHQCFVSGKDQRAGAAAQHRLFPEQVGLGLFLERGFDHTGARGSNPFRPGQRHFFSLFARIPINGDQRRHALAFEILAAHDVARSFGRDENNVHVFRRNHRFEVDGETVGKQQRLAGLQIRCNVFFVNSRLFRVRQRNENHIAPAHRFVGAAHLKSFLPRQRDGFAPLVKADDDVHPAVFEVKGMGVALRAEAEHRKGLVFQSAEVGVCVHVNFSRHGRIYDLRFTTCDVKTIPGG